MKLRQGIALLVVTLLALVSVLVTPGVAVAQEPGQAVVPPAGGPGTEFAFFATGFDDGEQVGFWATAPNGVILSDDAKANANRDGRADWTWTSPANAMPGIWTMVARGVDSNVERVIPFEIDATLPETGIPGQPVPDANYAVAPAIGGPGTEFAFFATGFDNGEQVGYWVNTPDGRVMSDDAKANANRDGRADWTWTSPANAMPGTWTMVARGVDSNREQVIMFEISTDVPPTGVPGEPIVGQDYAVAPASGPAGTEFAFFATGFDDGEQVGFWVNTPDGRVLGDDTKANANRDGRADWQWRAPADAMPGIWTMVVRGVDSNREQIIMFEVR